MNSLQKRLTLSLSLAIIAFAFLSALISAGIAWNKMQSFQDNMLRFSAYAPNRRPPPPRRTPQAEDSIIIERLRPQETHLADGYHTIKREQESYRIFIRTLENQERIAALQPQKIRNRAARNAALQSALPLLLFLPLLALIIALICQKLLKEIKVLAQSLDQRNEHDDSPIPTDALPEEIKSYTKAINRLLIRNARIIAQEKRFIADAAHELRTPLSVLTLHAENLKENNQDPNLQTTLNALQEGLKRQQNLINQLLTLARSQEESAVKGTSDIKQSALRIIAELYPLAEEKNIDLGIAEISAPSPIQIPENDLETILKNLIDNAIRHCPNHSQIDLYAYAHKNQTQIIIEDNGAGIAKEHHDDIFKPFHRLEPKSHGTGLGLAIVKALCDKHQISIALSPAHKYPHGLRIALAFRHN